MKRKPHGEGAADVSQTLSLTDFPFDHTLPPTSLFGASAQTEAEVRLKHLLPPRGIGLLTGEPGSGKTTLCRQWCESLHPGLHRVTFVSLTTGNVIDMYNYALTSFMPSHPIVVCLTY